MVTESGLDLAAGVEYLKQHGLIDLFHAVSCVDTLLDRQYMYLKQHGLIDLFYTVSCVDTLLDRQYICQFETENTRVSFLVLSRERPQSRCSNGSG